MKKMTNDNDQLDLVAYNCIEITLTDPLSQDEIEAHGLEMDRIGIDMAVNRLGRILTYDVDSDEQLHDIIGSLADLGVVEDIGLIKIQTLLEPQWDKEMMINVSLH